MHDPPSAIRAHQSEQKLELAWENEGTDFVPYYNLRAECPCAVCRDEWTGERILDPKSIRSDLKVETMEPIGGYAIRLAWNDGHSSGLYTWDLLHRLSVAQRARGVD